jgi:hypothetical protein
MLQSKKALPGEPSSCVSTTLILAFLFLFVVATRWPLAPKYLYYFDSANFALSLENFNPALHQPQPPGYPLYVLLIRFIHVFVGPAEKVLLISGLVAAFAAIVLIFFFARDLFGHTAGVLGATLLASNPAFWFAGITNQVRIFLAVGALGVGWLAWRALTHPDDPRWLYAAFGALGIAAGFRPELGVLLLPLLAWVWWQSGHSAARLITAASILASCTLPWLAFLAWVVGGPQVFLNICRAYTDDQFSHSSLFFGATGHSAYKMFASAVVWTFLGSLIWVWAVPLTVRRIFGEHPRRAALFLAVAFLPTFLFSAFVHIGDPDQALAGVAFVCLFGGGVLAALLARWQLDGLFVTLLLILPLHAWTFFFPPSRLGRASGYKAVVAVDRLTRNAIDGVRALDGKGQLIIVHYGSPVASRQLTYYFPDAYVVVLPGPGHSANEYAEVFHHHVPLAPQPGIRVDLPAGLTTVVCVRPTPPDDRSKWAQSGSVYYRQWIQQAPITIGGFSLARTDTVTTVSNSTSSY